MNHYFEVQAKCGHVGKGKCIFIYFAVKAENKKVAAAKARNYKRVKHGHKDAIRNVREISHTEYIKLLNTNKKDPYLQCKNIQQQRDIECFEDRIEVDEYLLCKNKRPASRRNTAYLVKKNAIIVRDALSQILDYYCDNNIAS